MGMRADFGSHISEVGAVMIVGGNILGETPVMTTAIVLETRRGNFGIAIALGAILLGMALRHQPPTGIDREGRSETALVVLKEKTSRRPPGFDRAEPADGSCITSVGSEHADRDEDQKEDDRDDVKHLSVHFSLLSSVPTQPARTLGWTTIPRRASLTLALSWGGPEGTTQHSSVDHPVGHPHARFVIPS